MPRLLHAGTWYDPVSAKSLYEADYEAALMTVAPTLFEGMICVPFKPQVQSDFGAAQPDLALIDRAYRFWYVVEVELDTHPLKSHVEEQVRKFATGRYTLAHAEYLCSGSSELDTSKVQEMLLGDQPRVLVVVTSHKPDWAPSLAQYGAQVGVVEMFRNDRDEVLFRVNGDQPSGRPEEVLSSALIDRYLPRALRLGSPAPFAGHNNLELLVDGATTKWDVHRISDAVWITPVSRMPVDAKPGIVHNIVRLTNGELGLIKEHN